jgi:hypothetical protein
MRSRLIPAILIFAGLTSVPGSLLGQRDMSGHQLSVRQLVDLELLNLQKNITSSATRAEGLHRLEKSLARMKSLRQSGPVQWNGDELTMDRMMGGLEEINKAALANNAVGNCDPVRNRLLRLYDPRAQGRSEDPTLKQNLLIWSELCHKTN